MSSCETGKSISISEKHSNLLRWRCPKPVRRSRQKRTAFLRQVCEEVYLRSDTKQEFPRVTLVGVGKRHHTHFHNDDGNDKKISGTIFYCL